MTEQNPTVVLVHGAFAESASWSGVIERLREQSLDVVAVANPLRDLPGDSAYLRDVLAGIEGQVVSTDIPAWLSIPSWFVFSDADLNIPVQLHRFMAKRAGAKSAREVPGASHALGVSQPDIVAESILEAMQATVSAQ